MSIKMGKLLALAFCALLSTHAAPLQLLWEFETPDRVSELPLDEFNDPQPRLISYIFSTPAVDQHGNVYFGAANKNFYSLKPSGKTNWVFATGAEIQASPAIAADGTIYFGSGDHNFYALDPDGREKWRYTVGADIYGSPALAADGTIYFGSRDANLYALNPDGSLKWKFPTGSIVERPPVLGADGTIYFGSFDGNIYAVNPANGSKIWNVPAAGVVGSLAIGSDHTIYAATGGEGQQLLAISPAGKVLWSHNFGAAMILSYSSAPAIGPDGVLYVGASDKTIYAINPDGTLKWSRFLGDLGFSAATLADDGTLYIAGGDMHLYAIDSATGKILQQFDMPLPGVGGGTVSAPNLAPNNKLYVGSGNGKLYAFTTPGNLHKSAWPTAQANAQRTAQAPNLLRAVSSATIAADTIRFDISIYDPSVAIESSIDLKKWLPAPFTREGNQITITRDQPNAALFYRIRYGAN